MLLLLLRLQAHCLLLLLLLVSLRVSPFQQLKCCPPLQRGTALQLLLARLRLAPVLQLEQQLLLVLQAVLKSVQVEAPPSGPRRFSLGS